jgi:hypothetical protein
VLDHLGSSEKTARVVHEELENRELFCCQGDFNAPHGESMRTRVKCERPYLEDAGAVGQVSTRERAQPRDQLAQGGRLDEVVVGPRFETFHSVFDRIARCQHQYRRAHLAPAELTRDLEPVPPGQHHTSASSLW